MGFWSWVILAVLAWCVWMHYQKARPEQLFSNTSDNVALVVFLFVGAVLCIPVIVLVLGIAGFFTGGAVQGTIDVLIGR